MPVSPAADQWVSKWKNKAQNKRQVVANFLSQNTVTPKQAWKRQMYVTKTQNFVDTRKKFAQAYLDHLQQLGQVLATNGPDSSPEKTPKSSTSLKGGNLSD